MPKVKPKLTPLQRARHELALKQSAERRKRINDLLNKRGKGKPKIIQSIAGEDSPRDRRRFGESEAIAEARKPRRNR